MKKKWGSLLLCMTVLLAAALLSYPHIQIDLDGKLIVCSYTERLAEFEQNQTYSESYSYYAPRDISIYSYDERSFLFFRVLIMEYVPGDMRSLEFVLEESYIENFLANAQIQENPGEIDLAQLIEGREAVVGNTRYTGNDYTTAIYYVLDGKHQVLFVFYVDDLLVVQVGLSDEGPRFIAYK